jgi:hypothetical protein
VFDDDYAIVVGSWGARAFHPEWWTAHQLISCVIMAVVNKVILTHRDRDELGAREWIGIFWGILLHYCGLDRFLR